MRKYLFGLAFVLAAALVPVSGRAQFVGDNGGMVLSYSGTGSFIQLASASRNGDSATSAGESLSEDIYSQGNDTFRLYAGYDYSLLGDIIAGAKATATYYLSQAATAVSGTGNSGILFGAAWGKRLTDGSELSLHFEFISSEADTFAQSNPNSYSYQSVGPNMADLTLQYSFDVLKGPGNRTSLSLGGGYYHAIVDYTLDENNLGTPSSQFQANGAMTGDTAGGMLGISEQVQITPQLGLNLFVQGRLAQFNRVQASSLSGYSGGLGYSGPYSLANINAGGGHTAMIALPDGVIDSSAGLARYVVVDYSGLDGGLSLELSF